MIEQTGYCVIFTVIGLENYSKLCKKFNNILLNI